MVVLLHEEPEPTEWKELHVGAGRSINSEHMQALLAKMLQRHWECQEDRRVEWVLGFCKNKTAFVASLDVRTAFDVAKPSVVSRILACTGIHKHVVATLPGEMKDVRGSARFENGSSAVGEGGQIRLVDN